jgi:hypothetical protein
VLSGLGALWLLVATLHPSLPGGDAGELAAAACAGGVAHPPGYPLHGLLLRAFLALPFGAPLWRLNLSSAVCGALAVGLLVDLLRRWTGRLDAGLLAGALWLVSPLPWLYATTVEVFSLHALLVVLVAWTATRDMAAPTARTALALGLASGLALANHHTALFVVAPVLVLRVWRRRGWPELLAGVALGLTPYLLLVRWSATVTPFSWGDLRSVDGFLTHLLRREYGTFRLASRDESASLFGFLGAFAGFEAQQLFGLVALLGAAGAAAAWRRSRRWTSATGVTLALALLVFGALANLPVSDALMREVVSRFFLLPHLVLCAAAGLAVTWRSPHPATGGLVATVLALGALHAPSHDATTVRRYGERLLAQPAQALVLTQGDLIGNATRALQACEGVHPDLRVLDQQLLTYGWYVPRVREAFPDVRFPGDRWHPSAPGAFSLEQFLSANRGRLILVCGDVKPGDTLSWQRLPWGLCERLVPPGEPVKEEAWFEAAQRVLPDVRETSASATPGSWEYVARRDFWHAKARLGLYALNVGIARGDDGTWLRRAYALLSECAVRDEAPQAAVFKNLGIAAGRLAAVEPARAEEMKRAFRRYLELAPPGDPELPAVRALVEGR